MRSFTTGSLTLAALLVGAVSLTAQSFRSDDATVQYMTGFGLSVGIGNGEIVVGEAQNTYASGFIYVYRKDDEGSWDRVAKLAASDGEMGDGFGQYLDVDGERMVVTAHPSGSNGIAYVFEHDGRGNWQQVARLSPNGIAAGDRFGAQARIDGDYVFVGADRVDSTGAVIVFHRDDRGTWVQQAMLKGSDLTPGDRFGWTFDLDDGKALISARGHNEQRGAVYAFQRTEDGTWQQQAIIAPDDLEQGDQLAFDIVLEGPFAVLGSIYEDDQRGAAIPMVWESDSSAWRVLPKVLPFDGRNQTRFGRNVALADGELLVGGPGDNGFAGTVYAMSFDLMAGWTGVTKISPTGLVSGDYFGGYIAAKGNTAVVGMRGSGAARILEKNAAGKWEVTATLKGNTRDGLNMIAGETVTCQQGAAAMFDCGEVNLASFMPVSDLGGEPGIQVNDVWGWEDPDTHHEYALVGRQDATAFVDITDPNNPLYVGQLPRPEGTPASVWRDIKVYDNHAFIVADGAGQHGMQVFDLTDLRRGGSLPVTFEESAHYAGIGSAHNIVINEETGFAYAVGVNSGGETCGGGLHMINIQDPDNPTFAGCFSDPATGRSNTGYSHDAQCITYRGPDADYRGHEICLGSNETALSIADVTDKDNPVALSNASYPNVGYAHQGWVTDDQRYFFMDDELDELNSPEAVNHTRTLIWDISDLDDPLLVKEYFGTQESSDHNLYIQGNLMYQANYMSGLRILDISDPVNPVEVGYFDTVPLGDNSAAMGGAWSNYPFFHSGTIIVTSGQEGLFVLRKKQELVP